jgi:hypothetical protein
MGIAQAASSWTCLFPAFPRQDVDDLPVPDLAGLGHRQNRLLRHAVERLHEIAGVLVLRELLHLQARAARRHRQPGDLGQLRFESRQLRHAEPLLARFRAEELPRGGAV